VINGRIRVEQALMTTVHSYTASQALVDGPAKDTRENAGSSFKHDPTTTGAAIAVTKVLPELEGRFTGMSVRVPTPVVSASGPHGKATRWR